MAKELKKIVDGNVVALEAGQSLQGKLMKVEESRLYKGSYAVTLDTAEGSKTVFVSNIVVDKLEKAGITTGREVKIEFLGLKKNQKGTAEYKNYEVYA